MRALSREHADGWGIAAHTGRDWHIARGTECAADSQRYAELASAETQLMIAHVRKKTVGGTSLANTHPFHRDGFILAHNGTIAPAAVAALAGETSAEHRGQIAGDTDSERLFAFVRTQIDRSSSDVERGVSAAVRMLAALGDIGSASFLFSCGQRLYAHRHGRSLFTLERADGTAIASEPLSDDPWREVDEGALLVIDTTRVYSIAA